MVKFNQPFFILNLSPWTLLMALNTFNLMIFNIMLMNFKFNLISMLNLIMIISISILWWRDIIRESTFQGNHNFYIMNLIKLSMILFIISDMFLFISFSVIFYMIL